MKTYGRGKKNVKSLPDPVDEKIFSFFYKSTPSDELGSSIINYEVEIKKEQIDSNSSGMIHICVFFTYLILFLQNIKDFSITRVRI